MLRLEVDRDSLAQAKVKLAEAEAALAAVQEPVRT